MISVTCHVREEWSHWSNARVVKEKLGDEWVGEGGGWERICDSVGR